MNGVRRQSTRVACPDGLAMGLDLYLPEDVADPLPVNVICHGFKGFKDWGMFPALAERLAGEGRAVAVFDYSHNGIGDVPGEFTRLDLFREQTVSRHVQDLGTILDYLDTSEFSADCGLQRNSHFNVVGHSMGGAVSILRAAEDARIVQVTTLNSVSQLVRLVPEQIEELERTGQVNIVNQRTGQEMPLGRGWVDDAASLDVEEAACQVFVPSLVICAEADASVPPAESEAIHSWIAGSRLVTVSDTDHVFGSRHPFGDWTTALDTVHAELDGFLPHLGRLGGV